MTFFLVIDLVLRIFSFFSHIFRMFTKLSVVYDHFLTRKTIFHSVHAFTHIRQHYFSKYWGDQCMGSPPHLKFWGDRPPSPPRSPPLNIYNTTMYYRYGRRELMRAPGQTFLKRVHFPFSLLRKKFTNNLCTKGSFIHQIFCLLPL